MSDHIVSVPQQHIQATKEQFELYQEIDTTFEMCKICSERSKDMRIEPCGHLICTHCLREWQKQRKSVCPFCRHEIRDTSRVKVLGYLDKENKEITSSAPPSPRASYIPRTSQSSIASPTVSRSYPREGSAHATDLLTAPLTGRRHASSPSPIPPPSPDTASSRSLSVAPSRPPPEPGMYVRSRSEASLPSLPQNGDISEPIYANVLTTAAATPPRQPRHQTTPNQPIALAPPPPLRAPSFGSLPLYSSPLAQAPSTPSSSSANHNGVGSINSTPHVPARRRPSSTGSMGASTQNVPGMVVNAPSRPLSTVPSEEDSTMHRLPVIISTQSSGTLTHMHTHPPPAPRRSLQSDFSGTVSFGSDREIQSDPQRPPPGLDNTQSLPDMSSPVIPPRPSHSPSPLAGQLVRGAGSNAELNTAAAGAPAL